MDDVNRDEDSLVLADVILVQLALYVLVGGFGGLVREDAYHVAAGPLERINAVHGVPVCDSGLGSEAALEHQALPPGLSGRGFHLFHHAGAR